MSYEHCEIHDCDATNGCPHCICEECGQPYGENHTAIVCERQKVLTVLKELVRATSARNIEGGIGASFLRFEKALSDARKFLDVNLPNAQYGKSGEVKNIDYVSAYPSTYSKPTLQELRLGRIIGEAAAKWWKVEDWYKSWQELKKEKPYLDDPNMHELYNLIVSLLEEKRR